VDYQKPPMASRPVRLAPRPAHLAGREDLLGEVHERLVTGDEQRPQVAALYGLGGVGKTSVALEYAHRHLYEYGLVWQLTAEDPTALAAGFSELAAQMGARDLFDKADSVAQVHGVLAARSGGWLLVFDNVPDPAAVRGVLPPAGSGHVLITSQNPHWPAGQAIEVPVLDHHVAAGFLLARTGDADKAAARDLAWELGGLPLALEQASAFSTATGRFLDDYLQFFRQRRTEMLARGEVYGYDKRVTTTWNVAFQQLQETAPGAVALLWLLACYGPDQIPVRLLLNPGTDLPASIDAQVAEQLRPLLADPIAVDDALTALGRYSLTSTPVGGSVSIHRLVQAVTADQLPADRRDAWNRAAGAVLEAVLPDDPNEPRAWPSYAALLSHARAVLPAESEGMANMARYLHARGDYRTARMIAEQVLESRRRLLGEDHPGTVSGMSQLAFTLRRLGELELACQLLEHVVESRGRILGDEDPRTLTARHGRALVLRDLGRWDAAEAEYRAVLDLQRERLGNEHPDALTTCHSLASVLRRQDKLLDAEGEYRAVLDARRRVLGEAHPDTLDARHALAYVLRAGGQHEAAETEYRAIIGLQRQVLGEEHPNTLATQHNLAFVLQDQGRWGEAEGEFRAVLDARRRMLGEDHLDTLDTRHAVAYVLQAGGQLDAAEVEYRAVIDLQLQVLGEEHPNILGARRNLAALLQEQGRWDEAEGEYRAVLDARRRVLGEDHPDTLDARHALAYVLRADS
jgi:tetratricopeptide (TPR) repeat protein